MPLQWVEPDVFVEYKGVKVYHTYHNDLMDQGSYQYFFSTNPESGEDGEGVFDVRKLPTWNDYEQDGCKAIREAIDQGYLENADRV